MAKWIIAAAMLLFCAGCGGGSAPLVDPGPDPHGGAVGENPMFDANLFGEYTVHADLLQIPPLPEDQQVFPLTITYTLGQVLVSAPAIDLAVGSRSDEFRPGQPSRIQQFAEGLRGAEDLPRFEVRMSIGDPDRVSITEYRETEAGLAKYEYSGGKVTDYDNPW